MIITVGKIIKLIKDNWEVGIVGLFGLTPVFWYKGAALINGVDTNFPLNPLSWWQRRFYVWDDTLYGGSDWSSNVAGLFFHGLQVFFSSVIGLSLQNTEKATTIFWFVLICYSIYFLFRTFERTGSKIVRLIPVVLYAYNIYLFNTWENIKVTNLSLVATLPLFLGVAHLVLRGKMSLVAGVCIVGILSIVGSGMGINPAYWAVSILSLIGFIIFFGFRYRVSYIKVMVQIIAYLSTMGVLNAYWILPLAFSILGFGGTPLQSEISSINAVNWVDGLSANTSLLNLFRLIGAWDWFGESAPGVPYIPYAVTYFTNPFFIFFSLLIPCLAFLALFFGKKRRETIFFAFLILCGIFLSAGTHPPTGRFFKMLLSTVPFFSFFRSPWYIFTPVVTLSIAINAGILFEELYLIFQNQSWRAGLVVLHKRYVVVIFAMMFIMSTLFYTYPLIDGSIFRADTNGSVFVTFPSYVLESGQFLDHFPRDERMISLPYAESENFSWEYKGIASVLNLLAPVNMLTYNFSTAKNDLVGILTTHLYRNLHFENAEQALKMIGPLNVSYLFQKHDATNVSGSNISTKIIDALVDKENIRSFGQWDFLPIKKQYVWQRLYVPDKTLFVNNDDPDLVTDLLKLENSEKTLAIVKSRTAQSTSGWIKAHRSDEKVTYLSPTFKSNGIYEYANLEFNPHLALLNVDIPQDNYYELYVEDDQLNTYGLNTTQPWQVAIDQYTAKEDIRVLSPASKLGKLLPFGKVFIKQGKHTLTITLPQNRNFFTDPEYVQTTLVTGELLAQNKEEFERLPFDRSSLRVRMEKTIPEIDGNSLYQVTVFDPDQQGDKRVITIQQNTNEKNIMDYQRPIKSFVSWPYTRLVVRPLFYPSSLTIRLTDRADNSQLLDNPGRYTQVHRLFTNPVLLKPAGDLALLTQEQKEQKPKVTFEKISPVKYLVHLENVGDSTPLVFLEKYSPLWKLYPDFGNGKAPWSTWNATSVFDATHTVANGYANIWFLGKSGTYDLVLEYWPQKLFYTGLLMAGIIFPMLVLTTIRLILLKYYGE